MPRRQVLLTPVHIRAGNRAVLCESLSMKHAACSDCSSTLDSTVCCHCDFVLLEGTFVAIGSTESGCVLGSSISHLEGLQHACIHN